MAYKVRGLALSCFSLFLVTKIFATFKIAATRFCHDDLTKIKGSNRLFHHKATKQSQRMKTCFGKC